MANEKAYGGSTSGSAGMKGPIYSAYKAPGPVDILQCPLRLRSHMACPWLASHTSIAHKQFMAPAPYLDLSCSVVWSIIIATSI